MELKPGEKIIQHWRTSEFDPSDDNSRLEIVFEAMKGGTLVTIRHSNHKYKRKPPEEFLEEKDVLSPLAPGIL